MGKKSHWVDYPEPGQVYRHYKGGLYEVITLSTHTETGDKVVVYRSILFGTIMHRPLEMWFEEIPEIASSRFTLEK